MKEKSEYGASKMSGRFESEREGSKKKDKRECVLRRRVEKEGYKKCLIRAEAVR